MNISINSLVLFVTYLNSRRGLLSSRVESNIIQLYDMKEVVESEDLMRKIYEDIKEGKHDKTKIRDYLNKILIDYKNHYLGIFQLNYEFRI